MNHVTPGINKVLVVADEPEKKVGSIYIPTNKQKIPNTGTLKAIGELRGEYKDMVLPEVGSHIAWHPNWEKMPGYEVDIKGIRHYLIHVEMILGEITSHVA